ncbi:MAG: MFS transporter [Candidatus Solibacter sp.]
MRWQGTLTHDARYLFATRFTRLFAYGALSVVLVFYLTGLGLSAAQTGLLFTLILAGDTVITLFLTSVADRYGRRRVLLAGALLMAGAGVAFALTSNFLFLLIAGTIGVVSPSGNEVGPFLSIEQAVLAHVVPGQSRTAVFAWHSLIGSFATALGSLFGGVVPGIVQAGPASPQAGYRAVVILYAAGGILLAAIFARLSPAAEVHDSAARPAGAASLFGLTHSRALVFKLAALMGLDAFGGGFVVQSMAAYWFYLRYGVNPATLGGIFFGANLFAGISALLASRLAARFGLVNTMVFTHLPSNILLILVPLMPTLPLAITVLLLRFSISQMDVPTRQSYLMAVVRPEERSASAGITAVARTVGASLAPWLAGLMFASGTLVDVPFFLAGGLKIVYDLVLYREFVNLPEQDGRG